MAVQASQPAHPAKESTPVRLDEPLPGAGRPGPPLELPEGVPPVLAGRFALQELIGIGGVGSVYGALDRRLNRPVAIKIVSEKTLGTRHERAEQVWREAMATACITHPHIVTVLDFGWEGECAYVIMERLQGPTLEQLIEQQGPLQPRQFVLFARQGLDALAAAHGAGIVHLDMKPSNFMLEPTHAGPFHVKMLDFGLSRFWTWPPSKTTAQQEACVFGTVHYLAPEQFTQEPLDQRTDLYSFGCVLYEALTGKSVFEADTTAAMMEAHLHQAPIPVERARADIPRALADWVMRFLEKAPARRWQTALQALEAFAKNG